MAMSNFSVNDTLYMQEALRLARRGIGQTSPNPMVGAVVVRNNEIVGRGWHPGAGRPHAEIFALEEAGEQALDAELFVTLEPCNHQGRTPPCTESIIRAGIRRVVIGTRDPNPAVTGHGAEQLESSGIKVEIGLLEEECRRLNEAWNKYITTGMPFVTLKAAASLDGRIATRTGHSQWITNEKSRAYVHQLRAAHDAILIGIGTLLKDNPRLTARRPGMKVLSPCRIVLDSLLRTPLDSKIFGPDGRQKVILATRKHDEKKLAPFRAQVREILTLPTNALGQLDIPALFKALGERQITSVLIEGGSEINGSALDHRIVDKICFFYAPILIGGRGSLGMISGEGVETVDRALRVKELSIRHFDDNLCLEGYLETTAAEL